MAPALSDLASFRSYLLPSLFDYAASKAHIDMDIWVDFPGDQLLIVATYKGNSDRIGKSSISGEILRDGSFRSKWRDTLDSAVNSLELEWSA